MKRGKNFWKHRSLKLIEEKIPELGKKILEKILENSLVTWARK